MKGTPVARPRPAAWACFSLEIAADAAACAPEAVERLGAHVVAGLDVELGQAVSHRFEPVGFSLVRFGGDGRLAIHTWPEHHFLTIDVWTGAARLERWRDTAADWLSAQGYRVLQATRTMW